MGARTLVVDLKGDQASSEWVCKVLRDVLRAAVESGPGATGGIESIQCRANATLYGLLMDHPVDQRGRCRSCRRSGGVLGLRRRLCRVHVKADYWLRQPAEFLHGLLARELGLTDLPPAHDSAAVGDRAGLPPSDHGGVEELPEHPRPRRAPFNDHTGRRTEVAPGAG